MTWVSTMFHQGGPTMYWIEYAGVVGVVLAAIAIVSPKRWNRLATLAMIVVVLGIGGYGTMHNRHMVADMVEEMSHETPVPTHLDEMREQGAVEASRPIEFAACVAGGLAVLLGVSALRRRAS